jgi:hypothetical protein
VTKSVNLAGGLRTRCNLPVPSGSCGCTAPLSLVYSFFFRTPALTLSLSSSPSELRLGCKCAVAEWVFSLVEWGAALRLVSSRCFSSFTFGHLLLSLLLWVDFGVFSLRCDLLVSCQSLLSCNSSLLLCFSSISSSRVAILALHGPCTRFPRSSTVRRDTWGSELDLRLESRSCRITRGSLKYFSLLL